MSTLEIVAFAVGGWLALCALALIVLAIEYRWPWLFGWLLGSPKARVERPQMVVVYPQHHHRGEIER